MFSDDRRFFTGNRMDDFIPGGVDKSVEMAKTILMRGVR